MRARPYLSHLHQDLIDAVRDVDDFKRLGDEQAWVLCCDGFCCILDFSKYQNPIDLVSARRDVRSWHLRQEEFGGLLWNPHTNRVFELDEEAFNILMTLQEGTGVQKAAEEYGVSERDLFALMADIAGAHDEGEGAGGHKGVKGKRR